MNVKSLSLAAFCVLGACASAPGVKVKEPFQGSSYQSNNRFFRGTGKGQSSADNIARNKADLEAKAQLAGQVNTTVKQVSDQYLGQTQNQKAADVDDKFQSLIREVMNTSIANLRKIGEEKYLNKDNSYTVYIAYEINKTDMFNFLKKQAALNKTIDQHDQEIIQKVLDEELKKAESAEKK